MAFLKEFNLSSLNGNNGFVINGVDRIDGSGYSVSNAGDVNGDGIDDLIIGARSASPNGNTLAGKSYVVFGSKNGFNSNFNLSSLNGSNGFVINGINKFDFSGSSVSSAGDFNGDGFDDLIIGAIYADPNSNSKAGESYLVFGSSSFNASLNLSSLNGRNGFIIDGIDKDDLSGSSVSSAGDINGDGLDDLIIGAKEADFNGDSNVGESYVIFGSERPFRTRFNPNLLSGGNGFIINGIDRIDYSGFSVSGAGDVNGDGLDDLIIGAPFADPISSNIFSPKPNVNFEAGESYVVFGAKSGFGSQFSLSSLSFPGRRNGFVINGIDRNDRSGHSVSNAGDINGDGVDDLIIGAPSADVSTGETYVVFGSKSGFKNEFNLSSLDGSNGFTIYGVNRRDYSGHSVSSAGDVNGDGVDDLIIGARHASPNGESKAGQSYVVFGSKDGFNKSLNLSSLNGSNGFIINGIDAEDYSGYSVSGAGDINGDGIDDLIIGAYEADSNGNRNAGESYVIFGVSDKTLPNTPPTINQKIADQIATEDTKFTFTIPENTFTDADAGDELTYTVKLANDSELPTWLTFNSETFTLSGTPTSSSVGTLDIKITATDKAASSVSDTFTITVEDLNDAPTDLNLSNNTVAENESTNTEVGTFTSIDEDSDIFTYDLVTGEGDIDNSSFTISDNKLLTNASFDYESKSSYSIRVKTTDNLNQSFEKVLTIQVSDVEETETEVKTTLGTAGKDKFKGTTGNDAVNSGTGNDYLNGKGGDDVLDGGEDNDRIYGGAGNDTLIGGTGNDFLSAGADNDSLDGGEGRDRLYGGEGDDTLNGGAQNDFLKGEAGNDSLNGGEGNDRIYAGDGIDIITGVDLTTFGVGEKDYLKGGDGNDTFVLGNSTRAFYQDEDNTTKGKSDYALILDFATGDTIQLFGVEDNYEIEESRRGVNIYMKDDGVGDLIGVVRKASLEEVNLGISFLGSGSDE